MSASKSYVLKSVSKKSMALRRQVRIEGQQSLIRVKRCKDCKTQFLIGMDPGSSYYKSCSCGRSDLERQKLKNPCPWSPLNKVEVETVEMTSPASPNPRPPSQNPSVVRKSRRIVNAWHDFSGSLQTLRKAKVDTVRQVIEEAVNSFQHDFWTPAVSPDGHRYLPSRPRRVRHARSIRAWLYSFSRRSTRFESVVSPSGPPPVRSMSDTQHLVRSSVTNDPVTFHYENPAFQPDFVSGGQEVSPKLRRRRGDIGEVENASAQSYNTKERILQDNFTIGSTSSLIVAMLSYASFAYFLLWLVLYCWTLNVILPEMKYLHKYVTVSALVLLTGLNSFRFYVHLNADKHQNSYLFTGTKTLTVLVIAALTSLLVTDAYTEHPRPFHVIISTIFMLLLNAEGIAILWHHHRLKSVLKNRID